MRVRNVVAAERALSLSLKTVDGMEGCTWSAVFSTSEKKQDAPAAAALPREPSGGRKRQGSTAHL